MHAACAAASTPRPPAIRPASRPELHAPSFGPAQDAHAFNQPLSFDTSSVKTMSAMFQVGLLCPTACSWALPHPVHTACAVVAPRVLSRLSARTSSRIAYSLLSTRQGALAFDQPLSFNTSSVTSMCGMSDMFEVRSHVRGLSAFSWFLPVHVSCAAPAPSPPLPALAPSVGRKLLLRRKQAIDSLRMGG